MKTAMVVTVLPFFMGNRLALAQALVRQGDEVVVLSSTESTTPADLKVLSDSGIRWLPFECTRSGVNPLREGRAFLQILRTYRKERFDLVHHFAIKPSVYGTLAAQIAGTHRIVNTITGLGYVFIPMRSVKRAILRTIVSTIFKIFLKGTRGRFIFQNSDDQQTFVDRGLLDPEQCRLIWGSGVETQKFTPSKDPGLPTHRVPRVLLPARMLWDKGVGEAVEAARVLRGRGAPIELVLAGAIDLENRAAIPESQVRQWESEGLCHWVGEVKDIAQAYRDSDLVILPSYREGIPRVLIEALACEKPVITCDVPGCRDVVKHEVTGLLVPVRDGAALARAIERMTANSAQALAWAREGRKDVIERFSAIRVIGEHLNLYRSDFFGEARPSRVGPA